MLVQALAHVSVDNKKIFLFVYLFFAINACSTTIQCADHRRHHSRNYNQAIARLNALNNQKPPEQTPYEALGYAFGYAGKGIWNVAKGFVSYATTHSSNSEKSQAVDHGWSILDYEEDPRGLTVIRTSYEKESVRKPAPR